MTPQLEHDEDRRLPWKVIAVMCVVRMCLRLCFYLYRTLVPFVNFANYFHGFISVGCVSVEQRRDIGLQNRM